MGPAAPGNLRNHLFRWGTEYGCWWHGGAGEGRARSRLTSFRYLQARLSALPASEVVDLAQEYARLQQGLDESDPFHVWGLFVRGQAHLLGRAKRGDWGAERILLQLACEHADDSPVTKAAEEWLAGGGCDWVWLRRSSRPALVPERSQLAAFEFHSGPVKGLVLLDDDGTVLSWSRTELCLWNHRSHEVVSSWVLEIEDVRVLEEGILVQGFGFSTLGGHSPAEVTLIPWGCDSVILGTHGRSVRGAISSPDGRLITWSMDGTICVWDLAARSLLGRLSHREFGPTHPATDTRGQLYLNVGVYDCRLVDAERLVSSGFDGALRVWSLRDLCLLKTLTGHLGPVEELIPLEDGQLASRSRDGTLRIWDLDSGERPIVVDPGGAQVLGAIPADDGRLVIWTKHPPFLFVATIGDRAVATAPLEGHGDQVVGAEIYLRADDVPLLLTWSMDRCVGIWDLDSLELLWGRKLHDYWVVGALLDGGRLVSWSRDKSIRVVDLDADDTGPRLEHGGGVSGLVFPEPGTQTVISWAEDGAIRKWDLAQVVAAGDPDDGMGSATGCLGGRRILVPAHPGDCPTLIDSDSNTRIGRLGQSLVVASEERDVGPINSLIIDCHRTVLWNEFGQIEVWDLSDGSRSARADLAAGPSEQGVRLSLQVAPPGRLLILREAWDASTAWATLHLFSVELEELASREEARLPNRDLWKRALRCSPLGSGHILATWGLPESAMLVVCVLDGSDISEVARVEIPTELRPRVEILSPDQVLVVSKLEGLSRIQSLSASSLEEIGTLDLMGDPDIRLHALDSCRIIVSESSGRWTSFVGERAYKARVMGLPDLRELTALDVPAMSAEDWLWAVEHPGVWTEDDRSILLRVRSGCYRWDNRSYSFLGHDSAGPFHPTWTTRGTTEFDANEILPFGGGSIEPWRLVRLSAPGSEETVEWHCDPTGELNFVEVMDNGCVLATTNGERDNGLV